jgi:hypothetical protein
MMRMPLERRATKEAKKSTAEKARKVAAKKAKT